MRAIWKGAISFGLVNIPVHVYSASQDKELKFIMLHKKDMSEIRYARLCKLEEKEVPWNEIVKAYEVRKGDFVVLSDEDFERASLKKNNTIEILHFVDEEEIDSIYYAKPYFLEPDKQAGNAYSLLREALAKSKKVGVAKYIIRHREHLAVVKAHDKLLILNDLRYSNEIIKPQELTIPTVTVHPKELQIALQLINQRQKPFKPEEYRESYTEELKALIKQKAKGRPIHPQAPEEKHPKIHDIMSLLQASLTESKKKAPKKARKTA